MSWPVSKNSKPTINFYRKASSYWATWTTISRKINSNSAVLSSNRRRTRKESQWTEPRGKLKKCGITQWRLSKWSYTMMTPSKKSRTYPIKRSTIKCWNSSYAWIKTRRNFKIKYHRWRIAMRQQIKVGSNEIYSNSKYKLMNKWFQFSNANKRSKLPLLSWHNSITNSRMITN